MERQVQDFAAIATQYARDVVDGRIPACKWHRLACQRHLADLAKAESAVEAAPLENREQKRSTAKSSARSRTTSTTRPKKSAA
jgi:phage terminase large subunit-like protein